MMTDYWTGFLAGIGWGIVIGGPLGVYWFRRFITELAGDDDEEEESEESNS